MNNHLPCSTVAIVVPPGKVVSREAEPNDYFLSRKFLIGFRGGF
jgi:hypothetical protein